MNFKVKKKFIVIFLNILELKNLHILRMHFSHACIVIILCKLRYILLFYILYWSSLFFIGTYLVLVINKNLSKQNYFFLFFLSMFFFYTCYQQNKFFFLYIFFFFWIEISVKYIVNFINLTRQTPFLSNLSSKKNFLIILHVTLLCSFLLCNLSNQASRQE